MPHKIKDFFKRHQEPLSILICIKSGIKGLITVALLSGMTTIADSEVLMASFGATCILVYTKPHSPFCQPVNIVGGFFVSAMVSVILLSYFPHSWWVPGIMVGLTISLMAMFRVTHPPAGAVPLIVYESPAGIDFTFVLFPCLSGSILLVLIAFVLHKVPPMQRQYPLRLD